MQRENVFGNKMQYPKVFLYNIPEDNYNVERINEISCINFLGVVKVPKPFFMSVKIILGNTVWYNRKMLSKLF